VVQCQVVSNFNRLHAGTIVHAEQDAWHPPLEIVFPKNFSCLKSLNSVEEASHDGLSKHVVGQRELKLRWHDHNLQTVVPGPYLVLWLLLDVKWKCEQYRHRSVLIPNHHWPKIFYKSAHGRTWCWIIIYQLGRFKCIRRTINTDIKAPSITILVSVILLPSPCGVSKRSMNARLHANTQHIRCSSHFSLWRSIFNVQHQHQPIPTPSTRGPIRNSSFKQLLFPRLCMATGTHQLQNPT